jgi:hypothetical protein
MTLDGYREIMRASAYDADAPDDSRPISMTVIMNDTLPDGYDEHTLGDSFDAAGTAMLDLLGTLAGAGDRYHDLLVDWSDSRIRKVVKHARAAKFERARAALADHGCPFAVISRRSATALVIAPLTEAEQHDAPWFHVIPLAATPRVPRGGDGRRPDGGHADDDRERRARHDGGQEHRAVPPLRADRGRRAR